MVAVLCKEEFSLLPIFFFFFFKLSLGLWVFIVHYWIFGCSDLTSVAPSRLLTSKTLICPDNFETLPYFLKQQNIPGSPCAFLDSILVPFSEGLVFMELTWVEDLCGRLWENGLKWGKVDTRRSNSDIVLVTQVRTGEDHTPTVECKRGQVCEKFIWWPFRYVM